MSLVIQPLATMPVLHEAADPLLLSDQTCFIDEHHPLRTQVEQFIARRFFEVHGARISSFMPLLVAQCTADSRILAAVGIRSAAGDALFLEHYLDTPIELAILSNAGQVMVTPQRDRIVEIGNLASINRRASWNLFKMLSALLAAENFEWAVFTGCTSLRRMFKTMNIEMVCLGRALQSRLPPDQQTWGGYYEDNPQVVAGQVSRGCIVFEQDTDLSSSSAAA